MDTNFFSLKGFRDVMQKAVARRANDLLRCRRDTLAGASG